MVGTVSAARRLGGRRALVAGEAAFALGLVLGASLVFGALGLAGTALHPSRVAPALAAGRALPVLALAWRGEETALAERPQGLRILRALAALSLVLGTAAFVAGAARAATTVATRAADPSVAATDLAWQRPGVGG